MKVSTRIASAVAVVACASVAAGIVRAESFRCGGRIVNEGMTSSEFLKKCGEPDSVEVVEEPVFARGANGSTFQTGVVTKEYWSYDRGTRKLAARVTVEDGTVTKIELLSGSR